ncbi:exo-beta-N-acetylmuramidase NamZ family protein [Flavitalea flava]
MKICYLLSLLILVVKATPGFSGSPMPATNVPHLSAWFHRSNQPNHKDKPIITGADQTEKYVPFLKGKRIGILANPTTIIGKRHLVDSLLSIGISVIKVFGPEHGFRGKASAGIKVNDETDPATGVKVISLYGAKRKPSKEDLSDIDLMIFDVQDVGCRFYTYINVLRDVMEACAENNKELLILDRPNPNGYLVDGPILDMRLKSGIGMFPIPIAHGMTIAEFAQMINGEGWLAGKITCKLKIIPVVGYDHDKSYTIPVPPSPNLNTGQSVLLYPTLCLFEGTIISQGRGTHFPFSVLGAPALKDKFSFSFTPVSIPGMSETPLHMNAECFGMDLRNYDVSELRKTKRINIEWMIELYSVYPDKDKFFDRTQSKEMGNIDVLAGTYDFRKQIAAGKTAREIRASWEPGLSNYKIIRKKYLLYL